MTSTCIEWTGAKTNGYGQKSIKGKLYYTHRLAYEATKGSIPDGLVIDHLCRNRACMNPGHLEAVTSAENTRRGDGGKHNRVKTRCAKGHEYTPLNTYHYPDGRRWCRTCKRGSYERIAN